MIAADFVRAFRAEFPDLLGRSIAVALSGGADSVALLHLLHGARGEVACAVSAVHVNHHLRGGDADEDAAFCRELCRRMGIPLDVKDLTEPTVPRGVSPEAWWRRQRYLLLEEGRQASGAAAVATAHTADDQAETVLLKLLRGAGPRGVAGVRRRQGYVVRPLLDFGREALRDLLRTAGVDWREDVTNASRERPRGWIRHVVLPVLREGAPRAVEHLAGFATMLAEDDEVLAGLIGGEELALAVGRPVSLTVVRELPTPLRRRWVLALAAALPLDESPSQRQLASVESLVTGGPPAAVDLGRRWVLRRRGRYLHLSPPPCAPFPAVAADVPSLLALPGGFRVRLGAQGRGLRHRGELAAAIASSSPAWRSLRPGERLAGTSITESLARSGVPPEWRRAWPVLEAGGTMVWVPGCGVVEGWEGDPTSMVVAEMEEPWKRPARSCDRS
ncbi:MAG: tRNA lysidine(34) synthetase TilS [Acidobacteriota bacterium]